MAKRARTHRFLEYMDARATVDHAESTIKSVKVLGLKSRNGRTYQREAVSNAATKYEGCVVNIDHPKDPSDCRSYADRFGRLFNIRMEEGGLYGDLQYNPEHRLAKQFAWDAEHAPQNLGLSHNVEAVAKRRSGRVEVEAISKVLSVDVVADPATTNSLFEGKEMTLEELKAEHPEAFETLTEAAKSDVQAELDELRAFKAERLRGEAVDTAIAEAKLPAALVTESFRKICLKAGEGLDAVIEDRKAIAALVESEAPRSREQAATEPEVETVYADGKAFASAIC